MGGTKKEEIGKKPVGIFKYLAPLDMEKVKKQQEEMRIKVEQKIKMKVFDMEYEPPQKKKHKKKVSL